MRREEQLDLLLEQYKSGSIDPSSLTAKDAARVTAGCISCSFERDRGSFLDCRAH